ncbi:MAG: hypothetical protein UY92_C0005G0049 [Candidatus Magasanikbacteria bacterium GW2011_GWA2_56_11]|uniref:Uncharacterized protein n=1 Tax=Candidatus Magasanikbacteria bacterium GW2011_GWA2_56_11 TaxID=1619044 RepID=A0A0G2AMV0_9BACT|nr:MAG: hypothetical protein UY92_C0005G0049 [Candidatus Magasanikbacteria bacterium GW2011_GWA2_56_11]
MNEERYESVKESLLGHMRNLFEELEEEVARSHEEKYALLEDALENASDVDELRVAFEQWHSDHADEIDLGYEADEIWDMAINLETK